MFWPISLTRHKQKEAGMDESKLTTRKTVRLKSIKIAYQHISDTREKVGIDGVCLDALKGNKQEGGIICL